MPTAGWLVRDRREAEPDVAPGELDATLAAVDREPVGDRSDQRAEKTGGHPVREAQRDAGRVLQVGHHPPQIGAIDLVDSAEQVNHRIETVNAGRAHCAGRPRTPVLLRHEQAGRRALRGGTVARYTEPAVVEARL